MPDKSSKYSHGLCQPCAFVRNPVFLAWCMMEKKQVKYSHNEVKHVKERCLGRRVAKPKQCSDTMARHVTRQNKKDFWFALHHSKSILFPWSLSNSESRNTTYLLIWWFPVETDPFKQGTCIVALVVLQGKAFRALRSIDHWLLNIQPGISNISHVTATQGNFGLGWQMYYQGLEKGICLPTGTF